MTPTSNAGIVETPKYPEGTTKIEFMDISDLDRERFMTDKDYFLCNQNHYAYEHPGIRTAFQFETWRGLMKSPIHRNNPIDAFMAIFKQDENGRNLDGTSDGLPTDRVAFDEALNGLTPEAQQMTGTPVEFDILDTVDNTVTTAVGLGASQKAIEQMASNVASKPQANTSPMVSAPRTPPNVASAFMESECSVKPPVVVNWELFADYNDTVSAEEVQTWIDGATCNFNIVSNRNKNDERIAFSIIRYDDGLELLRAEMSVKQWLAGGGLYFIKNWYPAYEDGDCGGNHYCPLAVEQSGFADDYSVFTGNIIENMGCSDKAWDMYEPGGLEEEDDGLGYDEDDSGIENLEFVKTAEETSAERSNAVDNDVIEALAEKLELHIVSVGEQDEAQTDSMNEVKDAISEIDNNIRQIENKTDAIIAKVESEGVALKLDILTDTVNLQSDMIEGLDFNGIKSVLNIHSDMISSINDRMAIMETKMDSVLSLEKSMADIAKRMGDMSELVGKLPAKTPAELLEEHIVEEAVVHEINIVDNDDVKPEKSKEVIVNRDEHKSYFNTKNVAKKKATVAKVSAPKKVKIKALQQDWKSVKPPVVKSSTVVSTPLAIVAKPLVPMFTAFDNESRRDVEVIIHEISKGNLVTSAVGLLKALEADDIVAVAQLQVAITKLYNDCITNLNLTKLKACNPGNLIETLEGLDKDNYETNVMCDYVATGFSNVNINHLSNTVEILGKELFITSDNIWAIGLFDGDIDPTKCLSSTVLAPVVKQLKKLGGKFQSVTMNSKDGKRAVTMIPFQNDNNYRLFAVSPK